MEKRVKLSDELKKLIEDFIYYETRLRYYTGYYTDKTSKLYAKIHEVNNKQNGKAITWALGKGGKIVDCFWQGGLKAEESKKVAERNHKIRAELMEQLKKELPIAENPLVPKAGFLKSFINLFKVFKV